MFGFMPYMSKNLSNSNALWFITLMSRIEKAVHAEPSPLAALESMFMAHVDFITEHPGIPRMLFGELQRSEETAPKRMAQTPPRQRIL